MTVKTTSLGDLPRTSIGQPDPIVLPDPSTLFARRAARLHVLAVEHPMGDWLRFLAMVACAQNATSASSGSDDAFFAQAMAHFAAIGVDPSVPDAARDVLAGLASLDTASLATAWLDGAMPARRAGEAVFVAAALQVLFTRRASALDVTQLRLSPQRGLCPVCQSPPVAGMVTAAGKAPGARYLHCGLCATAWNFVRVACTGCGESKGLALQEVEGGTGAVKAETCDACQGYAKMFYQAKDMAIEPLADDLASLGLDLMVSDAGWSRLSPNPLVPVAG